MFKNIGSLRSILRADCNYSLSSLISRLPRMLLSSWVDNKRPRQRPQFNYGHGLQSAGVNIRVWGSLAKNRSLWRAITQQKNVHCNFNGGGYIWVDPEQLEQAAAKQTLPPPLSCAGVLLGLLPSPDAPTPVVVPAQIIPATTPPPLPLSPILVPNHTPQRCSRHFKA